ncbi:dihydroorotase [Methylococcus geothermalis]|uniref:Dihydroorotase n=1 Tax=Methylococcus geothermalis TaxID=2681310 RepID=A0A858Q7Y6_9GAMM|nr:dihydroorotase [Methylococcus geothermalis]QJD29937.1 dihydroorotase [Methylococcus geothermalis]
MDSITLATPDDWHLHLRDGAAMADIADHSARQFGRAVIMPNLKPPVTTVAAALEYRGRILAALPENAQFEPLMTLYLTDATPVEEVERAADTPEIIGFKLYPAGATTHSEAGVTGIEKAYRAIEALERHGVPLLVHGEVTDAEVDIFDREARFIESVLEPLVQRFTELRVVLEHVTTKEGVEFVRSRGPRVGATITAHHLLYNRNALLAGGIRPHHYCLPVLKRESHRQALVAAATSGDAHFFLGTDSAPHPKPQKESACGCAGCYTAYTAIELYAVAFERAGALHMLERFASHHGADFYGRPRNGGTLTLHRAKWRVPETLAFGPERVVPAMAGETLDWRASRRTL